MYNTLTPGPRSQAPQNVAYLARRYQQALEIDIRTDTRYYGSPERGVMLSIYIATYVIAHQPRDWAA